MSYSREDADNSIVYNDPVVVKGRNYPWKSSVKEVDDDYHPTGEKEEGEQESYNLDREAWHALPDNEPKEKPDYLTFWKGESDYHTIRHAQGKIL
jgi:hypothetical protein